MELIAKIRQVIVSFDSMIQSAVSIRRYWNGSEHIGTKLVGKTGFEYRFDVASQVMAAGAQDVHVQVIVPLSGPGKGQIGIRVGRLLVYVSNREALSSSWMPGERQQRWLTRRSVLICRCPEWANRSQPSRAGEAPAASRGPSAWPFLPPQLAKAEGT